MTAPLQNHELTSGELEDQADRLREIVDYLNAGFNDEDIKTFIGDNPEYQFIVGMQTACNKAAGQSQIRARAIMKSGKARELPAYGKQAGDLLLAGLAKIDRPLTVADLIMFTQTHGIYVASTRRDLEYSPERPVVVDDRIESGLCNAASAYLLSQCDLDQFSSPGVGVMPYDQIYNQRYLDEVNSYFGGFGMRPINPKFLAAKVEMVLSEIGPLRKYQDFLDTVPTEALEGIDVQEADRLNRSFARKLQKIRRYGIKPVVFPVDKILAGIEKIYSDKDNLGGGWTFKDNDIFAYVQLTNPEAGDERFKREKVDNPYVDDIKLHGTHCLLSLNSDGDLYLGVNPTYDAVPLRARAERTDQLGQYEVLRAAVLNDLFASIAPASIVGRLNSQEDMDVPVAATAKPHEPSDVVYPIRLPRIRYLDKPQGVIKQDVETAVAEEAQHIAGQKRLHPVAPFLRRLPSGAHASEAAIRSCKDKFGEDYEMPEGYTFVREHDRGDRNRGVVIGHSAVRGAYMSSVES